MMDLYNRLINAGVRFDVNVDEGDVKVALTKALGDGLKSEILVNRDRLKIWLLDKQKFEKTSVQKAPTTALYPLSEAQELVWFVYHLNEADYRYHMPARFNVVGSINLSTLDDALKKVCLQHSVLRTRFEDNDDGVYQKIVAEPVVKTEIIDLSIIDEEKLSVQLESVVNEFKCRKFDLVNDLPFRTAWVQLPENEGQFLVCFHHIVADGRSIDIALGALIKAFNGQSLSTEEIILDYTDYAYWTKDVTKQKNTYIDSQIEYWREQLRDCPNHHELCDKSEFNGISNDYRKSKIVFSPKDSAALHNIAQKFSVTPFILMHGLLSMIIGKINGMSHVSIGIPSNNRNHKHLEDVVGLFLSTQVLKTKVSFETFGEYFEHIKQVHLAAHDNKDISFDQLVKLSGVNVSENSTPLFQILLNTTTHSIDALNKDEFSLGDAKFTALPFESVSSKYDIDLSFDFNGQCISSQWIFNNHVFNEGLIKQLQSCLTHLVATIVETDLNSLFHLKLASLQIVNQKHRHATSVTKREEDIELLEKRTIIGLFEEQVQKIPHEIALRHNDKSITFSSLNGKVNKLAHYLSSVGTKKGDRVGVCMSRSISTVVSILAILKTGACYVPMESSYPLARLNHIVKNAAMSFLLTDSSSLDIVQDIAELHIICLDDAGFLATINDFSKDNLAITNYPNDPLYVYYTSGSTGVPKGVVGTHIGALNRCYWMWENYPFEVSEKACFKTALGFVDAVWEMFGALLAGKETVVVDNETVLDQSAFLSTLIEQQVSRLIVVPSLLKALFEERELFKQALNQLNIITVSGEPLSNTTLEAFHLFNSDVLLLNLYGSSEVSADVTFYECHPGRLSRIGKPIDGMSCYVLNKDMTYTPQGFKGELYVSGLGVAKGYLGLPELTEERFTKNPYSSDDKYHRTLFKTGDIVYQDDNQQLVFVGRRDSQVKLLGKRIDLLDIEENLQSLSFIDEAVVFLKTVHNVEQLVAYYTLSRSDVSNMGDFDIANELSMLLPDFMAPQFFILLQAFPRLYNGKVDRNSIEAREIELEDKPQTLLSSEAEMLLANIWAAILKLPVKSLFKESNFFEVGGNSLLVMKLLKSINREFFTSITLKQIFKLKTLANIASQIEMQNKLNKLEQILESNTNAVEMDF